MEDHRLGALVQGYQLALECVSSKGYEDEVAWARESRIEDLTESVFLAELAWVVLNAGMREAVVRARFARVAAAFWGFRSASTICATADTCVELARRAFNHPPKLLAIVEAARRIESEGGFDVLKTRLHGNDALAVLERFDYVGPVTVWHLARNIGIDCAKPDRHLTRLARRTGFVDAAALCQTVAHAVRERIGVVDVVFWRHMAISCQCWGVKLST